MNKLGIIFLMLFYSWGNLMAQEYQFYLKPDKENLVKPALSAEPNPLKNVNSTYCVSLEKQLINPTTIDGRYEINGILVDSVGGFWNFIPNTSGTFEICYYPIEGSIVDKECKIVVVSPALDINFTLSTAIDSLCIGDSRTITLEKVGATGTGNLVSFQWNSGETTSQITADLPQLYIGKAFDEKGCSDSISYLNKIRQNKVSLGNDVVLCKGDSITFSTNSSVIFLNHTWTNLNTSAILSQGVGIESLKVKKEGQYEIVAQDGNCVYKDTVTVTIDSIQVSLSTPKDSICYNENVVLNASPKNEPSGTITYLWEYKAKNNATKLIGTTADNIKSITTSVDSLGKTNLYYVTITSQNNCSHKDSLLIYKNDSLQANIIPSKIFICGDETVVNLIDAEASKGIAPYKYLWQVSNNSLVKLANEDSLKVGVLSKTPIPSEVLLTFSVTDKLGCTAQDTVTARLELFKYEMHKEHKVICPGMTDSLYSEIVVGGSDEYGYLWFGENLPTNNLPYVIVSPTTPGYHEYNLSIFDKKRDCKVKAFTDSILVREIIADIDFGKDTVVSCDAGVNISTSVSSTGSVPYTQGDPYRYTWNLLDGPGSFTNGSEFIQNTTVIDGVFGQYSKLSLDIIDSLQCKDSDTVLVYWNPPINHDAPDTSYICLGGSKQINVTGTGGSGTLTYDWKKLSGQVLISNSTSNNPTFSFAPTVSQDTSYVILTVSDIHKCEKVDTILVISTDFKINAFVKDAKVCPNSPINLDVTILLGGSGKYTYKWTASNGTISDDAIKNPTVTPNKTVTYEVTVTDQVTSCVAIKSFQIPFTVITPIISKGNTLVQDTTVVCFGNQLTLDTKFSKGGDPFDTGNEYLYNWNVTGSGIITDATKPTFTIKGGTGDTYTTVELTLEDEQGCQATKSTKVYWNKLVKPFLNTTYVCTPAKGILSLDSSQGLEPFKSFLWEQVNSSKLIIETQLKASSFVSGADNDTVQVKLTVTDSAGCVGSEITTVIGLDFQASIVAKYDSICPALNNPLTANVTNDGKGPYTYNWTPTTTIDKTTTKDVIVNPLTTTTYSVLITDEITGCQVTTPKEVKVINLEAVISGTIDTLVSCIEDGKELSLDAKLSKGGSPAYNYTWTSSSTSINVVDGDKEIVKLVDTGLNRPITTQVNLLIEDQLGCQNKDSLAIFWNTPLTVSYSTILNDTAYVCGSDLKEIKPAIVGGIGTYTYKWSVVSGNVQLQNNVSSLNQLVSFPINATKVPSLLVFEVKDSLGCVVIDSIVVKANEIKVGTSVADAIICPNAQTKITLNFLKTGSGLYSYNWTPANTLKDASVKDPIASPNKTTTYKVTVTDDKTFCTAKGTATVIVYDLQAQISHQGVTLVDTSIICLGTIYEFEATNSTGGTPRISGTPYLYDWKKVGSGLLNGSSTQTVTTEQGTPKTTTQYILTISDQNDCKNRDTVTVYWNDLIKPHTDSLFVCSPSKGVLTIDSINGGVIPYTYQWKELGFLNQLTLEQTTNDTALVSIPSNKIGSVLLTVTDKAGCQGIDTTIVKALDFKAEIIVQFNDICPNVKNELSVNVIQGGTGKYTYSWSPNKFINDTTLKQVIVNPLTTTTYSVLIKDTITACQLTVDKEIKVIDLVAKISGDVNPLISCIQDGKEISLDAKLSIGGSPTYKYTWTSSSSDINVIDEDKDVVKLVDAGLNRPITTQVKLSIEDQLGCVSKDSLNILWNAPLTISYSTILVDTAYVCGNESKDINPIIVGGTGIYTYKWSVVSGNVQLQNDLASLNQVVNFTGSTKLTSVVLLEVKDSLGCSLVDTLVVKVTDEIKVGTSVANAIICPDAQTKITLNFLKTGSGLYSYNWTPANTLKDASVKDPIASPNKTTTYKVTVTDDKTFCKAKGQAVVIVYDLKAEISHQGVSLVDTAIICLGTTYEFEATNSTGGTPFTSGNPYLYDWKKVGSGLLNGSSTQTITTEQGTPKTTTQYILTISDQNGCKNRDTVNVYWNDLIKPHTDTLTICTTEKGVLTIDSITGGMLPYTYQWKELGFLNQLALEQTINDTALVTITNGQFGKVLLTVTDKAGCQGIDTTVIVGKELQASIVSEYDTLCPNLENTLTANVVGGSGNYTYAWSPNQSITDTTLQKVTVKLLKAETYTVKIKDNVLGCETSVSKKLNVLDIQVIAGNIIGGDTLLSCQDSIIISAGNTIGGTGKYTYSWTTKDANQTLTNIDKKEVIVLDKGLTRPTITLVNLSIVDNLGCSGKDSVYINWNPQLNTSIEKDFYACLNVKDTLSSTTTDGTGSYKYQWKVIQGDLVLDANTTDDKVIFEGVTYENNSIVQLTVTDFLGCQAIDTLKIQTQAIQNPTLTVNASTLCKGTTLEVTANAQSTVKNTTLSYNWNNQDFVANNKFSAKILNDTLVTTIIKDNITSCEATVSQQVKVQAIELIVGDLISIDTLATCIDSMTVSSKVTGGSGNYTYSWTGKNANQTFKNADEKQVTIFDNGLARSILTLVNLDVTDNLGCKAKDSVYVNWNSKVGISIEKDFYACLNVKDTLSSTIKGGTGVYQYQWKVTQGDLVLDANTTDDKVIFEGVTYENNSKVQLTVIDEKGCQASDSLVIQTQAVQNAKITVNSAIVCEGRIVDATASGQTSLENSTLLYTWNNKAFSNKNTFSTKVTKDTTLLVIIKDQISLCEAQTTQNIAIENIEIQISGLDTVFVCSDSLQIQGDAIKGGSGNYTYSWTDIEANQELKNTDKKQVTILDKGLTRPLITVAYLNVSNEFGCKAKDSVYMNWNPKVSTTIENDFYACLNEKDTLSSTTIGGTGNYQYQWKVIQGNLTLDANTTTDKVIFEGVTYENNSIVELTVTDEKACQAIDTLKIQTQAIQNAKISLTSAIVCTGTTVDATASAQSTALNSSLLYTWNNKDFSNKNTFSAKVTKDTTLLVIIKDEVSLCQTQTIQSIKIDNIEIKIGGLDTVFTCLDSVQIQGNVVKGGSGNYTYSWTDTEANQELKNTDKEQVTILDKGLTRPLITVAYFNVSDEFDCKAKDSVYVNWNSKVSTTIENDFYACLNEKDTLSSTTIGGTGNYQYQWKVIQGDLTLDANTTADKVIFEGITYENNSIVELTVIDERLCQSVDTLKIQTQAIQNAKISLTSAIVCTGTTVDATASAQSTALNSSLLYTWNNKDFSNKNTFSAKVSKDTTLLVIIKDEVSLCQTQTTQSIKIENIEVQISGLDTVFTCLDSVQVQGNVIKGGSGNYTYSWTDTEANQELKNTDKEQVTILDKGLIRPLVSVAYFNASDEFGCKGIDSVHINWNSKVSTTIENDFYACLNEKDTLSSTTIGGTGNYQYQWKVIQGDLAFHINTTSDKVIFEGITYENNSIVELTVIDERLCQSVDTLKIQTQAIQNPTLTVDFDKVCKGSIINATASGQSSVNTNLLYSWNNKDFSNKNTFTATISKDTNLVVLIKDDITNCQAQVLGNITVEEMVIKISSSATKKLCFEEQSILSTTTTGGTGVNNYQWFEEGTLDLQKDSANVHIKPSAKGLSQGTFYKVIVKDVKGCMAKDSIELFRNEEILADAGKNTTLCFFDNLTLGGEQFVGLKNGTATGLNFNWNILKGTGASIDNTQNKQPILTTSVADEMIIELVVTDAQATHCQRRDQIIIEGKTLPSISLVDTSFCQKDSVLLIPLESPYPKGTYLTWTTPDNKSIKTDTFVVKLEGTYQVSVIDTFACKNTKSIFVREVELPTLIINPLNALLCSNDTIKLNATVTPLEVKDGEKLTWTTIQGTGKLDNENALATFYNPIISESTVEIQGVYENSCGKVIDNVQVSLGLAPDVKATISETEVNIGDPVMYELTSGDKPNYTYTWGFEGTTIDTLRAIGPYELTYDKAGTYKTSVTVKNSNNNCFATDSFSVKVNTISMFYIPSVFSLSAKNEVNASWRVFGKNISNQEFSVMVYNRWGELVYETTDLEFMKTTGWIGQDQDNGKGQPLGVYTYVIKGKYQDNQVFEKVGTVTIVQ